MVRGQAIVTKLEGKCGHVAIVVKDVEKLAKVYRDTLGVPVPLAQCREEQSLPTVVRFWPDHGHQDDDH
jgi:hypothetical protein